MGPAPPAPGAGREERFAVCPDTSGTDGTLSLRPRSQSQAHGSKLMASRLCRWIPARATPPTQSEMWSTSSCSLRCTTENCSGLMNKLSIVRQPGLRVCSQRVELTRALEEVHFTSTEAVCSGPTVEPFGVASSGLEDPRNFTISRPVRQNTNRMRLGSRPE